MWQAWFFLRCRGIALVDRRVRLQRRIEFQTIKTPSLYPKMTTGSLDLWLKAVADNKINAKNTWEAPIIDHFSNIDEFRGRHGINFQKATTTLDGCVKVYSTRVDTVLDDTFKLLETLSAGEHDARTRQHRRKGGATLEHASENLNLRDLRPMPAVETHFLMHKESVSVFSIAKISSCGVMSLGERGAGDVLNLCQYPADVSGLASERSICPMLSELNPDISTRLLEAGFEAVDEGPDAEVAVYADLGENDNFAESDRGHAVQGDTSAPAAHIRGWAGPGHWKISRTKKTNRGRKKNERRRIDFFREVDESVLYDTGDTLISTRDIVKRRSERRALPEDFRFQPACLYRYLVRDGSFAEKECREAEIEQKMGDLSICDVSVHPVQEDAENVPEEMDIDMRHVESQKATKSLFLRCRRIAKKVDIRKLQENVLRSVCGQASVSLKTICREVPAMYGRKDAENISAHYCVLSLLFLAHSNNLEIRSSDDSIVVEASMPGKAY